MVKIEIDEHIWNGITHYLRALHQQKAVDDVKMHFDDYMPLESLLELWDIEPYPSTKKAASS